MSSRWEKVATVLPSCSQNALEPLFVGQCSGKRARSTTSGMASDPSGDLVEGRQELWTGKRTVEVVDLLFVGRRRAAVFEGAAVPGLKLVAKPAVSALQEFIASAPEAEVAVPGVVELVTIAHDGAELAGGTMGFRAGRQ